MKTFKDLKIGDEIVTFGVNAIHLHLYKIKITQIINFDDGGLEAFYITLPDSNDHFKKYDVEYDGSFYVEDINDSMVFDPILSLVILNNNELFRQMKESLLAAINYINENYDDPPYYAPKNSKEYKEYMLNAQCSWHASSNNFKILLNIINNSDISDDDKINDCLIFSQEYRLLEIPYLTDDFNFKYVKIYDDYIKNYFNELKKINIKLYNKTKNRWKIKNLELYNKVFT